MQTPRYVLRFEPLLYVPAFTHKDFHYVHTGPPTQRISTEDLVIQAQEYTTPLSNTTTSTQEARHKAKTQSPLPKKDGHKAKLQSPLHKRDKGTKPKLNHNHLHTRGIATNSKHNNHQRDEHKPKANEDYSLVITIDHKQLLVITIDHKQYFSQKHDPIDRIRDDS